MFNKIFYFIKRSKNRGKCTLKQEKGISLVEVIVAILIISIITVVLINGTIMAVNVSKMNRAKTLSSAVASEKLELIKYMDYEAIEITADNPDWPSDHPEFELKEDGYTINYEVTWVDGVDSYKQVEISVSKENMNMKSVSVITQIYPVKGPEEEIDKYPPPVNLAIEYDRDPGGIRNIKLVWDEPVLDPDTELEIHHYNIYRDGVSVGSALITRRYFIDWPGDDNVHSYYVTAVYSDGVESRQSTEVTTEYLRITHYSGGGLKRTVHLAWGKAPDIQLKFIKFVVYKDGKKYTELTDQRYSDEIGKNNYTYYVTAIYEGGIESEPSNEVTTTTQ